MDKNGWVIVLLIIVLAQSNAFSSRKLVQESPPSSPPPDDKKPALSLSEAPKSNNSSNVDSKGLNEANTNKSFGNSSDGKEYKTFAAASCNGLPICSDQGKSMIACIQDFVNGSNNLSLVVQNQKDVDLKVNITIGTSVNNNFSPLKIPAHGTKEVNITLSRDTSNKVILNAGNGDCELQISQHKTTLVNSPPKSKDPKSPSNLKDVSDPAKPKDADNPVENPTKPKDEKIPLKSKDIDNPSKPKSKEVDDPSKPKEVDDPSKLKDNDNPSKSKALDDPSKSKTSVDTHIPQSNFLDQLMFYSKQVTPIYGAYLAFVVALIIGGSWALCTFRKRRAGNGVPYQELEMGTTEPSNAVDLETAEGWDHDWDDDDWDDEDKAIRSPGGGVQTKSISSNGLTSRAVKKNGWDADWDD